MCIRDSPTGAPSSFTLLCVSPAINDLCENALEWTFNDTTSIDIAGSNGDETIPCYDGQNDGVWYTFEGDGGYVSFASGDKDAAVISYILMAGECDSLTCLAQGSFTPDEILEMCIRDSFLVSCDNKAENDSCVYSQLVTCGDMISGRLGNLTTDDSTAVSYTHLDVYKRQVL